MRVLFSCTAGDGHFYPLVPLAAALQEQGHEVAFAMARAYGQRITASGFSWFRAGIEPDELDARFGACWDDERADLLPLAEQWSWGVSRRFAAGDAPDRVPDLLAVAQSWCPDLIVFERCDFAAPVVAAATGVPSVHMALGRMLPVPSYDQSAVFVAPLWAAVGLDTPPLCGMYAGTYVDICPARLQPDCRPPASRVLPMRPTSPPVSAPPPTWLAALPNRPNVYVTLGTMFNDLQRFRVVLDALAEVDCNVIATIGRDLQPGDLEPVPANAVVEQFIPQALLLPRMDVAVMHGGSGSMLAALAHGVPLVMLPGGADQFGNAAACLESGVPRVLMPGHVEPERVRREVEAVLGDTAFRRKAEAMGDDIAALPSPAEVARMLTSLP